MFRIIQLKDTLTFLCFLALKSKYFLKVTVHVQTFRTLSKNNYRENFTFVIVSKSLPWEIPNDNNIDYMTFINSLITSLSFPCLKLKMIHLPF